MITQVRSAYQNAYKNAEYVGLSGDNKADIEILNNGDIFTELDTGNIYIYNEESNNWDLQPKDGGGGTAGVSSFKGRTGNVVPLAGDYTAEMVGAASSTDLDTTNQNITNLSNEIDNIIDGTTKITLPIASSSEVGAVKIGSGVSIAEDGTISVESSVLPPATADTLGGIKVGSGLSVTDDGILSATDGNYLPLSGGTMTGDITMGGHKILRPSAIEFGSNQGIKPTDVENVIIGFDQNKSAVIYSPTLHLETTPTSGNPVVVSGVATPVADEDAANKKYVDDAVAGGGSGVPYLPLAGGTMAANAEISTSSGNQSIKFAANQITIGDAESSGSVKVMDTMSFTANGPVLLMGTEFNANSKKITSLAAPTNAMDAANKAYVDAAVAGGGGGITEEEADARYLRLSGGTLTGNLSVGNNKITMGATPTEITDVVNKGYTDGVVKVVSDEVDGIISGATPISIPIATDTKIGGVKAGTGVSISTDGTLSVVQAQSDIPMASETTLGSVKVGTGLYIEDDGTLEATAGIYRDPAAGVAFVGPSESKTIMLQKAYQVLYIGYMYISSTVVDPIGTVPIYLNAGQNMTDQDTGHLTVTFAENGASFSATNLDSTVGIFIFYGGFQEKNS